MPLCLRLAPVEGSSGASFKRSRAGPTDLRREPDASGTLGSDGGPGRAMVGVQVLFAVGNTMNGPLRPKPAQSKDHGCCVPGPRLPPTRPPDP